MGVEGPPVGESHVRKPSVEEPAAGESQVRKPSVEESQVRKPPVEESQVGKPSVEESSIKKAVFEKAVAEEPSISSAKTAVQRDDDSPQPPEPQSNLRPPPKPGNTRGWFGVLSRCWWWEIGASAIGVSGMLLLLTLLFCIDNTPASAWSLGIRPNTIISITATVTRTAMMVSVASCISQLKWRHYLLHPHPLHHLQIFDDASRGPWGALKVLLAVKTKASLILALSVVTLVSLAVGPTTQQILDLQDKRVRLKNNAGELAVAYDYDSYTTGSDGTVTPEALFVRSTLLKALIGEVFQANTNCRNSTKVCSWSEITTLGVCRETRNVSGDVKPTNLTDPLVANATTKSPQTRYTYAIPPITAPSGSTDVDRPSGPHDLNIDILFPRGEVKDNSSFPLIKTLFNSTARLELPNGNGQDYIEGVSYAYIRLPDNNRLVEDDGYEPEPQVFVTRWYYCSHTFHDIEVNATGYSSVGNVTSRPLQYVSSSDNYTTSRKGYNIYNDGPRGQIYNISFAPTGTIWHTLTKLLHSRSLVLTENTEQPDQLRREGIGDEPDFGQFLYTVDHEEMLDNIAVAATNLIRSSWPWNGDNRKGLMVPGETFNQELYFVVSWPWVVVPVFEVTAIAVLLGLSIRKTWGQPLLKQSVAAFLLYGLQGWKDSEIDELLPADQSTQSLEKMSEEMVASLKKDGEGRWRFKRERPTLTSQNTLQILYSEPGGFEGGTRYRRDFPRRPTEFRVI